MAAQQNPQPAPQPASPAEPPTVAARPEPSAEAGAPQRGARKPAAKAKAATVPAVSVWAAAPKPARRGTAPQGLSRQRIVRAAVELLDAEGEQGFSMRRLATELGVTPMSVYWYVDNKSELLELVLDEVLGEMRIPPLAEDGDWREHLRVMAWEYRRCFQRHLWANRVAGEVLPLGPNAVFFNTSALAAADRTGLPQQQYAGVLGLVFQFVYGFATSEGQQLMQVRASGLSEGEYLARIKGMAAEIDERLNQHHEQMVPEGAADLSAMRDHFFAESLDIALDGVEARIHRAAERAAAERAGQSPPATPRA